MHDDDDDFLDDGDDDASSDEAFEIEADTPEDLLDEAAGLLERALDDDVDEEAIEDLLERTGHR